MSLTGFPLFVLGCPFAQTTVMLRVFSVRVCGVPSSGYFFESYWSFRSFSAIAPNEEHCAQLSFARRTHALLAARTFCCHGRHVTEVVARICGEKDLVSTRKKVLCRSAHETVHLFRENVNNSSSVVYSHPPRTRVFSASQRFMQEIPHVAHRCHTRVRGTCCA